MKHTTLAILLLILSGCSHKIIAKNCETTESGKYSVCDSVFLK